MHLIHQEPLLVISVELQVSIFAPLARGFCPRDCLTSHRQGSRMEFPMKDIFDRLKVAAGLLVADHPTAGGRSQPLKDVLQKMQNQHHFDHEQGSR